MYKLTFWNENLPNCCSGVFSCYTDDIEQFEREWVKLTRDKEQIERFRRSKEGELVTDFFRTKNDSELNIVQKDDGAKIFVEMETTITNRVVTVHNAYDYPSEYRIRKMKVYCRYVKYDGTYLRLMSFIIDGIARVGKEKKKYKKVGLYGNPILKYHGDRNMPDFYCSDTFEDYTEECIESIAWYPMGYATTLEQLKDFYGSEQFELTEEELDLLLCDLTCC